MKIISKNEQDTINFALDLAKKLPGGTVLGLVGDLGAGKTTFTKGLAQGLGVKQNVNSPTFVLMKIYPVRGHKTIKHLVHIDAYRLTSAADLEAIGAQDWLGREDTVAVVEWADLIRDFLLALPKLHTSEGRPPATVWINFKHQEKQRIINID